MCGGKKKKRVVSRGVCSASTNRDEYKLCNATWVEIDHNFGNFRVGHMYHLLV